MPIINFQHAQRPRSPIILPYTADPGLRVPVLKRPRFQELRKQVRRSNGLAEVVATSPAIFGQDASAVAAAERAIRRAGGEVLYLDHSAALVVQHFEDSRIQGLLDEALGLE